MIFKFNKNEYKRKPYSKLKFHKLIYITSLFLFHSIAYAQADLVFNITGQPPLNTPAQDGFMDEVSREALKRIGYRLVIIRLPAERALRSSNAGFIDGEMSRIQGLDKIYSNLIRVPEKIMDWDFFVFSKKQINLKNGWQSLEDKNIAIITGWKILEKNVPKTAGITKTKNAQQLFTLLQLDRADFIIYEHWGGEYIINDLQLDDIVRQAPALAKKEMFMYLHKKHAALVPQLTQALSEMKKDGSYQELVNKHLAVLYEKN